MKKTLFVDFSAAGHHYEYISHIIKELLLHKNDYFFTFILSNALGELIKKKTYKNNIEYIFYNTEDINGNGLINKFKRYRLLIKIISQHKYKFDSAFFFMLNDFDVPLMINSLGIKNFNGIYFHPPVINKKLCKNSVRNLLHFYVLKILSLKDNCKSIFFLNDEELVEKYSKANSVKFKYLVDPINSTSVYDIQKTKKSLNIQVGKTIYCHPGKIDDRKGSLTFLNSIETLNDEFLANSIFIFVGEIAKDFKQLFQKRLKEIVKKNNKISIIIDDRILEIKELRSIINASDFIVLPYKNYNSSSGIINHSIELNKIIIGPQRGYLGKLLKEYNKSICCDNQFLSQALNLSTNFNKESNPDFRLKYCSSHSIHAFSETIISTLK